MVGKKIREVYMRRRVVVSTLLFSAAVLTLVGCGKNAGDQESDRSALRYEMRTVERSLDSLAGGTHIVIEYPEIVETEKESALDSINTDILHDVLANPADSILPKSAEEYADRFVTNYQNFKNDFPDDTIPWTEERRMEVASDTNNVLGLEFSVTSYTGGAHPMSVTDYSNYDLIDGHRLALGDLFIAGYESELNKQAEPYFRKARDIAPTDSLAAAGFWFSDGTFEVNDNFLISADGLTFTFNPYEVAPYAMGPTTFTVPYSALTGIIDPNGPLAPFVTN